METRKPGIDWTEMTLAMLQAGKGLVLSHDPSVDGIKGQVIPMATLKQYLESEVSVPVNFTDFQDVDYSPTLLHGAVIYWDALQGKFVRNTLKWDALGDVISTGPPQPGQTLVFGGGGTLTQAFLLINQLGMVSDSMPTEDGQILVWNQSNFQYEPMTIPAPPQNEEYSNTERVVGQYKLDGHNADLLRKDWYVSDLSVDLNTGYKQPGDANLIPVKCDIFAMNGGNLHSELEGSQIGTVTGNMRVYWSGSAGSAILRIALSDLETAGYVQAVITLYFFRN